MSIIQHAVLDANGRTYLRARENAVRPCCCPAALCRRRLSSLLILQGLYKDQPVKYKSLGEHSAARALMHIQDAQQGRNILTMCALEAMSSSFPIKLYYFVTSNYFKAVMQAAVVMHLLLAFWQPVTLDDLKEKGTDNSILFLERTTLALVSLAFLVPR